MKYCNIVTQCSAREYSGNLSDCIYSLASVTDWLKNLIIIYKFPENYIPNLYPYEIIIRANISKLTEWEFFRRSCDV